MTGNGMITFVSPKSVMCHSYESPICPNTISFTSTVFSSCSAGVTSSRWAMLSSSATRPFCAAGILSACIETAGNDNPAILRLVCYAIVSFSCLFFFFSFRFISKVKKNQES